MSHASCRGSYNSSDFFFLSVNGAEMNREKANAADTSTTPIEGPAAATKEHRPSTLEDICTLGAVELVRLVREREITAVEVTNRPGRSPAPGSPSKRSFPGKPNSIRICKLSALRRRS
jgi:hypothetical protein